MATAKLCAADGCGKPVKCAGYCSAHYQRLYKTGRLELDKTEKGAVDRWMMGVAVPFTGDDCLPFPFARRPDGYGHISTRRGARSSSAHVFIAECAIGPKPSPKHEVCHSCGNGHLACVNPKHLYWGTRRENVIDRKKHGTFTPPPLHFGDRHHKSTVTSDQVLEMRALMDSGASAMTVARRYGVAYPAVYNIKKRKTWRHI